MILTILDFHKWIWTTRPVNLGRAFSKTENPLKVAYKKKDDWIEKLKERLMSKKHKPKKKKP